MGDELIQSPFRDKHLELEARMVDAAGWEMPLVYHSVIEEVQAVRGRAGIFDVSHMGRLRIKGDGALDLLEGICTADVAHQEDNTALPTPLCNERAGVIDHCLLLRLEDCWMLITSALCRQKVLEYVQRRAEGLAVKVEDQTARTAMVAVEGPRAAQLLDAVLPEKVSPLGPLAARSGSFMIARYTMLRGDFTGGWGVQVILPAMLAGAAWRFITQKAGENAIALAGLAALDVLRLEAGLPQYGYELNETIDPLTAGLVAQVDFGHEFVGRASLEAIRQRGPSRRRVGLVIERPAGGNRDGGPQAAAQAQAGGDSPGEVAGRPPSTEDLPEMMRQLVERLGGATIPRQGEAVYRPDGSEAGTITSASYSPTLDSLIAMAYVAADAAQEGTAVLIGDSDRRRAGKVVGLPFKAFAR